MRVFEKKLRASIDYIVKSKFFGEKMAMVRLLDEDGRTIEKSRFLLSKIPDGSRHKGAKFTCVKTGYKNGSVNYEFIGPYRYRKK